MTRTNVLLLVAVLGAGCDRPQLPAPSPSLLPPDPPSVVPLTLSLVSPAAQWPFYRTEVAGAGFMPGVRITFGGVDAPIFGPVDGGRIVTGPPWHHPGPVDVVVTNPDRSSATLAGGFTYKAATLELSKSEVSPGETVVVTWSGPHDPSDFSPPDIIGLYAVDDPHNAVLWSTASPPGRPGDRFSRQFPAPDQPGAYEVRYHMLSQYLLAKAPLTVR